MIAHLCAIEKSSELITKNNFLSLIAISKCFRKQSITKTERSMEASLSDPIHTTYEGRLALELNDLQ